MKVRKRPVIVEARQATSHEYIHSPEGILEARPGDWIVTGIRGEKYPVKPEIFADSYEVV